MPQSKRRAPSKKRSQAKRPRAPAPPPPPPRSAWTASASIAVVGTIVVISGYLLFRSSPQTGSGQQRGTSVALSRTATPGGAATATGTVLGQPIDGIDCSSTEQLDYHEHAYLEIYSRGKSVPVPAG